MSVAGKHALISGGGTGVGAGIARSLVAAGANVTIVGRREAPLAELANELGVFHTLCDVIDRTSVDTAFAAARQVHGPVAITVANAGAALSKPFAAMSADDVSSMLDVNVVGVFNLWQASLADMQEKQWGRLLAVASSAGLKGYPYVAGYCAAKHGVIGLTRALAIELARTGITVNALCPGFVDTPMLVESIANIVKKTGMSEQQAADRLAAANPMKRFISVEEVADAAVWLAQPASGSVNGQAVSINGGEV